MKSISPVVLIACMSAAVPAIAAPASERVPAYQLGSGHRAGGPASELISPTGGPILRSRIAAERERIPAYQLGSGHRAGGPARELISATGRPSLPQSCDPVTA
jgi:hypothetical protein